MAALHVVGVDLELRSRVDLGAGRQQQRATQLVAVRLLRGALDMNLALEDAPGTAVEHPLVDLTGAAAGRAVANMGHVVENLRPGGHVRSEERRVGKELGSTCSSRWSPCH